MELTRPKKKSQGVLWWVVWIFLTIGSFFVAVAVWTPVIASRYGSIHETRNAVIWVAAVFGSWMVLLVPLIIFMYQKVDKAYEDARLARERAAGRFRSILVDPSKRMLPAGLQPKFRQWPPVMEGGHLVTVILKDGRRFPHVFVQKEREILGIYGANEMPFEADQVADIEWEDPGEMASSVAFNWLRLDGVSPPD